MIPQEIAESLKTKFPEAILETKIEGVFDPYAKVAADKVKDVALFMRDNEEMAFDYLMCLSGVDYGNGKLGVVYNLSSMKRGHKFTLKVDVAVEHPHVQSVEAVWKTANWHEREAYDLIGIVFDGHPDLRRILLPDDWEGHPLRKDYQVPEYYRGMKVPY